MLFRRLFYRWLFIAAVVLPLWLIIGWAIFGEGGWGTLGLIITVPATFLSLLVISLLVNARPTVRADRAVSWLDVGVLGVWQLAIIGTGFSGASAAAFGILAVLGAVIAFWVVIWQLIADGSRRMRASMAEFERQAAQQGGPVGPGGADASGRRPFDDGDGDVIIVHESRD